MSNPDSQATELDTQGAPLPLRLPALPVCVAGLRNAVMLTKDGELKKLTFEQAGQLLHKQAVYLCHAPFFNSRIKADIQIFDVLELYLFVHPTRFCVPTVNGLASALGLETVNTLDDQPLLLMEAMHALLDDLRKMPEVNKEKLIAIAQLMGLNGRGWPWADAVLSALNTSYDPKAQIDGKSALATWKNLPEWSERAPPPPPSHDGLAEKEINEAMDLLLSTSDKNHEDRPAQRDYAHAIGKGFQPKDDLEEPHVLLAEAGTGIGKTVGYLAPAFAWARKNGARVWISTFTKNLQSQLEQELDRVYPNQELKDEKAAILKGRENYLCLLNFEDASAGAALARSMQTAVSLGFMARWIMETKEGDFTGRDYPGWATHIFGFANTRGLALKSGECIFSACDHYHRCFKERAARKAKHAELVVSNHALVMIQTALAHKGDPLPPRRVFDEGHHLFHAADSAFAAHLTARQTRDMRRWIMGNEHNRRASRNRGLKKRAEDLVSSYPEDEKLLYQIIHHAQALPTDGWMKRLKENNPSGPIENFFIGLMHQVNARSVSTDVFYSLECPTYPLSQTVSQQLGEVRDALVKLQSPMLKLSQSLDRRISEEDSENLMDPDTRKRIESLSLSLERRALNMIGAWIGMIETLSTGAKPEDYVDWMQIEKTDGQVDDVGLYRHWVDPMKPFGQALLPHAHGVAITSATLRDKSGDEAHDWQKAESQTGAHYLSTQIERFATPSPFPYEKNARVYIVSDVNKNNAGHVSNALHHLIEASGGGALNIFTSIRRLKSIKKTIVSKLNVPFYFQHEDNIDIGTLIDIFRENDDACLFGTDALRDGVDVPGRSLRMMTFDRVPWPRPTLLHKARRTLFGGRAYDEMLTRMKLQQAFGRLIRSQNDRGVFVMMDSAMPSRLLTAFPPNVEVKKAGLSEICEDIKAFLKA